MEDVEFRQHSAVMRSPLSGSGKATRQQWSMWREKWAVLPPYRVSPASG